MKKSLFTLSIICLLAISASATIRRVNPSPGIAGVNVYTTVLLAVTAAVANDTIQLEPFVASQNNYDEAITITTLHEENHVQVNRIKFLLKISKSIMA